MPVKFFDRYNNDIDLIVELASATANDHRSEFILIPERDEEIEFINDTDPKENDEPEILSISLPKQLSLFNQPKRTEEKAKAVIAVDSGVIDLGELATGGTIFAIRGAAVCYPLNNDQPFVCRYNTGAIVVDNKNMGQLLYQIGKRLGREDLFVDIEVKDGSYSFRSKSSMGDTANQIRDRFRNYVERMIQEEAIGILDTYGGGILLLDGALSAGTYDTPVEYVQNLLSESRKRNINVVAISKKTRIMIGGRPISGVFADQPNFIGYASLKQIIGEERERAAQDNDDKRRSVEAITAADDIFAVRFTYAPLGLTFRVDVHPTRGFLSNEVLDQTYSYCQIYGGYPRPLIESHQYSSFLFQDVQTLLADVIVRLGVRPQEQQTMEVLFQPFGGNFK